MNVASLLLATALLVTCAHPPPSGKVPPGERLGVVWEELPGNPRIAQPACPAWYCLGQTDPWVARGPDGARIAWFSTGGDLGGPLVGRAQLDDALNFTLDPEPVLTLQAGVWDRYRETVSTRWDPDTETWTMWYLGYAVSFFDDPGFGQMRSSDRDGTRWERAAAPIYRPQADGWDHALISGPSFIETPEGQWRLYYSGAGTTVGIGLLISDDRGQSWRPHPDNPIFERDLASWDQGILEVSVIYHEGRYLMWYTGYKEPLDLQTTPMAIGLAYSADGIRWQRSPDNPVLRPGQAGSWNDLRVVSPHVIVGDDGALYLFAHGQSRASVGRLLGELGVWRSAPAE
jgi:predicted GH43/DUF377 family glycosyl hydrolase